VGHKKGANSLLHVTFVKNPRISMPLSPLHLGMNDTHHGVNLAHLTYLMLLYYLVKVEMLKMHVNTNLAFNVNYEITIKGIKLR